MTVTTEGLFDASRLNAFTTEVQKRLRAGARRGLVEGGRDVAKATNADVAQRLGVKRKAFPSFKARVYDSKPERLPSLVVYSRVPWLNVHQTGGTVIGKGRGLLIPLLDKRIGPKAFRLILQKLLRTGAGFFKEVNGKVILFAEPTPELGTRAVSRFRTAERRRRGGRVRRAEPVPIAVLVPSVTLRKRFDVVETLKKGLPGIVAKIEKYIAES